MNAALLALASLTLTPTGDDPKAEEILASVYTQLGTPEALAAVQNRVFRGQCWFEGMGDKGHFVETYAGLYTALIVSTTPGFGEFKEGAGQGVVWELNPMTGGSVRSGADAATALRRYALMQNVPWQSVYSDVRLLGEEELEGRPAHKLALTPTQLGCLEDGTIGKVEAGAEASAPAADIWYVDEQTHEILRMDVETSNPTGGRLVMQISYGDWRRVDGIAYAFERRAKFMGFTWVQQVESVVHESEIAAELFAPPKEVFEAGASDPEATPPLPEPTPIRVERIDEVHVASIRMKCKQEDISATLSVLLPEVMIHLTSNGIQTKGAPFTRYYSFDEEEIDLEAGIPVEAPIEPTGRIRPETLPGGFAVSAWHLGPYDQLGRAHAEAQAWIAEHELVITGAPWEIYWTDPGMEPDPGNWRTQILFPCEDPEHGR